MTVRPAVGLVWAQAHDRVIGADGAIPWHLPEDLAHFKTLTTGATVVMGRVTWESLPTAYRPLPGRHNIVLTRRPDYDATGAEVQPSLEAALGSLTAGGGDAPAVWVIGGGHVYGAALPYATVAVVTEVDLAVDGDTRAPELPADWVVDGDGAWLLSRTGLRYRIRTWRPRAGGDRAPSSVGIG